MAQQETDQDEKKSCHKSLKINVMRDLKSAQKLKSAYSTTKAVSPQMNAEPIYERKNSVHNIIRANTPDSNSYSAQQDQLDTVNNKDGRRMSVSSNQKLPIEAYSKIKRSQTFSATLPRNYGKMRSSILTNDGTGASLVSNSKNLMKSSLDLGFDKGDIINDHSPTNSSYSFYNETKTYNNFDQGITEINETSTVITLINIYKLLY